MEDRYAFEQCLFHQVCFDHICWTGKSGLFPSMKGKIEAGRIRLMPKTLRSAYLCLSLAAVLSGYGFTCSGQGSPAGSSGPVVELKKNPIEVLRELEPPADAPYRLGAGDQITVDVLGRPELSAKYTVGPDGKITLPFAGSVEIADKTREEASAIIQSALSGYYEDVTASVRVDEYSSNEITLLGAVDHPGSMQFTGTPLLLDVISRGGTVPERGSSASGAATVASAYPEECVVYRGHNTVFTVELRQLLEENDSLADYRLVRGDIVYVPGPSKFVAMSGQILHPGTLQLHNTSTLSELLAEAGGPTEKAGRSPTVEVIHKAVGQSAGRVQVIPYKSILDGKPVDLTLQSGDIIYVPESGFNSVAYAVEKLAPLVNLVTLGALLQ